MTIIANLSGDKEPEDCPYCGGSGVKSDVSPEEEE